MAAKFEVSSAKHAFVSYVACHEDHFYDGDGRDQGHWHGGPYEQNWH
jgi:hypothetical protein